MELAVASIEDDMPFMELDKDRAAIAASTRDVRGRSHEIAFNS